MHAGPVSLPAAQPGVWLLYNEYIVLILAVCMKIISRPLQQNLLSMVKALLCSHKPYTAW